MEHLAKSNPTKVTPFIPLGEQDDDTLYIVAGFDEVQALASSAPSITVNEPRYHGLYYLGDFVRSYLTSVCSP